MTRPGKAPRRRRGCCGWGCTLLGSLALAPVVLGVMAWWFLYRPTATYVSGATPIPQDLQLDAVHLACHAREGPAGPPSFLQVRHRETGDIWFVLDVQGEYVWFQPDVVLRETAAMLSDNPDLTEHLPMDPDLLASLYRLLPVSPLFALLPHHPMMRICDPATADRVRESYATGAAFEAGDSLHQDAPVAPATLEERPAPIAEAEILVAAVSQTSEIGFVDADANLRAGPGTEYAIAGFVPRGARVVVTGHNGDGTWLQLDSGYWISAPLVVSRIPAAESAADATLQATEIGFAHVNANLYAGPGTEYEIEGFVPQGTRLVITGRNGDGTWLQLDSGRWIYVSLVVSQMPPEEAPAAAALETEAEIPAAAILQAPAAGLAYVNANLRTGPGTEYALAGSVPQGARLVITGHNGDGTWLQLDSGNWIYAPLVRLQEASAPARAAEPDSLETPVFPLSEVGVARSNANLRTGPGTEYTLAGSVPQDTRLVITGHNGDGTWLQLDSGDWIYAPLVHRQEAAAPARAAEPASLEVPVFPLSEVGVARSNANLRVGPGTEYALAGSAPQGARLVITGRNGDGTWRQLDSGRWIYTSLVEIAPVPTAPAPTAPAQPPTPETATLLARALDQINDARRQHGLAPVTMGVNAAAQSHAAELHSAQYLSHWDQAGLTPYMRYTRAGGQGYSAENVAFIGRLTDRQCVPHTVEDWQDQLFTDLMASPGHRDNILNPHHTRVNLGIVHACHLLVIVQLFEGDYVAYAAAPRIENGVLTLRGRTLHGTSLQDSLLLYWDPPPHPLTRTQLVHSACYGPGQPAALILAPLSDPNAFYVDKATDMSRERCQTPYDISALQPFPSTPQELDDLYQQVKRQPLIQESFVIPHYVAEILETGPGAFRIQVNIAALLQERGPGVYSVALSGFRNDAPGEPFLLSHYSIWVP